MNAAPTVKELRKSYPNCMTAIGYVEIFLCIPPDGQEESGWDILVKDVRGITLRPREVIDHIRTVLHTEIANPNQELPLKVIQGILIQIDTPKFYNYIKGKMGAM